MSRKLPLDPKLGVDANVRLHQLWVDAAIVTRDLQDQIDAKAPIASPTFTGTVTIPTPFNLGAVSVTATGTELNLLDGVTATTAELNILDGVTSTAAELNILDGVTATAAELNILDGVTATAAEINILDGVTASAAELNLLDGITALAAGTFTTTVTASTNVNSASARQGQYQRVNNTVTVSGQIIANTGSSGYSAVFVTLPVASTLTTEQQCCGAGSWYDASSNIGVVRIISGTSNRAELVWIAVGEEEQIVTFHFTYLVA